QLQCASNLRQFGIADQMYLNTFREWHLPAFLGKNYAFNRTWPMFYVFRKTLAMPVVDPNIAPNGVAYVEPKWRCPAGADIRGQADKVWDDGNKVWLWPMNYSYGMNVEGIEENNCAPGGSYPYNPPPPLVGGYDVADCPQIFLPLTGGTAGAESVHAFMRKQ